ncbi:glycerol-3-phosphate 1-O-acyltransferase PlsY [Streptococcus sp. CSL10205-OR2]|uniref:glycerol-3-phosphate 1-O-acyltransferase PlsY n=1 Tax=Streptococcus sp. CSL10205-OR2 TaxID=2980558 RepID=UPI0021D99CFF|nr:glycerol-3-phosphate 1-O-acyltransferase PlsY [Streptococcus sp. CSL10205-OR2]MCU9533334.1 glycerol-3-phosphate 1-O-acyltransferase PlsY [Streptococcus sp. CSL10205-OR2]
MKPLLFILIAYLLGSIQTGLWIGQFIYHKNIRLLGSGNTGTTNTFRILGVKAGIVTLLVDLLKGTLATLLPIWFGVTGVSALFIGFFAIVGHTFPIYAKFKGGKAVATSAGVLLAYSLPFFTYLLVIFLICLYLSSMISFSSMTVALIACLSVIILPAFQFLLPQYDVWLILMIFAMATIVIVRHKDNIKRIKNKTESTLPIGLNITKQKRPTK